MRVHFYTAVFLFALMSLPLVDANASIITETFSGTGALVSPGGGTSTSDFFTVTTTDASGCAQISFDITVATGSGQAIHFDTNAQDRGFGDTGGGQVQLVPNAESLTWTISAPTISLTAAAPAGSSIVGSNLTYGFTGYDLVNNGATTPVTNWTDNLGGSGGAAAAAGTNTGDVTVVNGITSGATTVTTNAGVGGGWQWHNNMRFEYSGDVMVDKASTVPEPGALAMLLGGLGFMSARRRRA